MSLTVKQKLQAEIREQKAEIARLTAEVERLKVALEVYSDSKNWVGHHDCSSYRDWFFPPHLSAWSQNGYHVAKAALNPTPTTEQAADDRAKVFYREGEE